MRATTLTEIVVGGLLLAGGIYVFGRMKRQEAAYMTLKYFRKEEFGPYWTLMDPQLLRTLDAFRGAIGYPVQISPAEGSIGRPILDAAGRPQENEVGAERSYHNYVIHGAVKAIDVMPVPPSGVATPEERQRWVRVARQVGFTGVGLYPTWRPRAGLHLDVRPTAAASWAWLGERDSKGHQVYVAIERGYV